MKAESYKFDCKKPFILRCHEHVNGTVLNYCHFPLICVICLNHLLQLTLYKTTRVITDKLATCLRAAFYCFRYSELLRESVVQ